jgi:hypothetical protein
MVDFKHCPREVNQAEDKLAKVWFGNKIFYNWIDEPLRLCKLINDVAVVGN